MADGRNVLNVGPRVVGLLDRIQQILPVGFEVRIGNYQPTHVERAVEALALDALPRLLTRALDVGAQAQLHLPRGLVGEGDGHDALELGASAAQQGHDATHQRRGLARPRCRLHEEGRVEVAGDALPRVRVDEGASVLHFRSRTAWRASSRGCHLRPARSSS